MVRGRAESLEALLPRWLEQIERFSREVITIHHDRQLWTELGDAVRLRAPESPGVWLSHYGRLYANSQAVAVRRLIRAGRGADNVSLGRLLESLEEHADLLTEEWVIQRDAGADEPAHWEQKLRREFRERWGSDGHVDPLRIHADRSALNRDARAIIEFADTTVAHMGPADRSEPTFNDLNAVLEHVVGQVFRKYHALLTGADMVRLTPTIQEPWKRSFGVALFPSRWTDATNGSPTQPAGSDPR